MAVGTSFLDVISLLIRAEALGVSNVQRLSGDLGWDCFPYSFVYSGEDGSVSLYVTVPQESGPDAEIAVWRNGEFVESGPWEEHFPLLVGHFKDLVARAERVKQRLEEERRREWEVQLARARAIASSWVVPSVGEK